MLSKTDNSSSRNAFFGSDFRENAFNILPLSMIFGVSVRSRLLSN